MARHPISTCLLIVLGAVAAQSSALANTTVAPPAYDSTNSTNSLSNGSWVASAAGKLRLSLDNDDGGSAIDFAYVYTDDTSNVDIADCNLRVNHADSSGSSFAFETSTTASGFTTIKRDTNISVGSGDFPEVEVTVQSGDTVTGGFYDFD